LTWLSQDQNYKQKWNGGYTGIYAAATNHYWNTGNKHNSYNTTNMDSKISELGKLPKRPQHKTNKASQPSVENNIKQTSENIPKKNLKWMTPEIKKKIRERWKAERLYEKKATTEMYLIAYKLAKAKNKKVMKTTRKSHGKNTPPLTVGMESSWPNIVKHIFLVKFGFIIQYSSFRGRYNDYSGHTIFRYHFYRTISKKPQNRPNFRRLPLD
jgi:uncharacterized protein YktA (UPF0223 family)